MSDLNVILFGVFLVVIPFIIPFTADRLAGDKLT